MEDIIIIGSGIAGYSAALALNQFMCGFTLITGNNVGGQLMGAFEIENYPGIKNISGEGLIRELKKQINFDKREIIEDKVVDVDFSKNIFKVITKDRILECKSVIIATGKSSNLLNINENGYIGNGVSYCAVCDGFLYKSKNICIIGGGDSAIKGALHLSNFAKNIHIFVKSNKLIATENYINSLKLCKNVEIHYSSDVKKILGVKNVEGIEFVENNMKKTINVEGVFILIGSYPNSEIFKDFLELDKDGYIVTNANCETNINGIFAAGDIQSNTYKQAIISASNGYISGTKAYEYIKKLNL